MDNAHMIAVFAALGHEVRLKLWQVLLPFGSNGLSAGQIAARVSMLPSSLSFHLHRMTQARILSERRSSRQIIYAVNSNTIGEIVRHMAVAIERGDGRS
jgi:ArsR family transcriptional regulator